MVLIVGGMAQGKLDFARRELGVTAWNEGTLGEADCVRNLQQVIRDTPDWQEALETWCAALRPTYKLLIGIPGKSNAPLAREDRDWREQVGRTCCRLAAEAEAVYRVYCGLGVRIK